jgi:hypothetical protein
MAIENPIEACRFWLHDVNGALFTDAQVQEFLDLEKVVDADGYAPDDDDYTATYDVKKAAGRGWLWMAGLTDNKPVQYRVGDISVSIDRNYCLQRARELLGLSSATALRRDEQFDPDVLGRYRHE